MGYLFPTPLILGHRGSPHRAPENTLRAFSLALDEGADGVELDVQRAGDGTPVVIHDATLNRTGYGEGPVAARSWPELAELSGSGEPLPSLRQAAGWAAARGAWLNVEIKAEEVEDATLRVLRDAGTLERTLLSSFSATVLGRLRVLAPDAPRFLLTEAWHDGAQSMAVDAEVHGVCLRVDAASHLTLDVLRRQGFPVIVWTVDDPRRMRDLLDQGVAGLITNRPAHAAEARRGR